MGSVLSRDPTSPDARLRSRSGTKVLVERLAALSRSGGTGLVEPRRGAKMGSLSRHQRIERLAGRVGWLDRHRRLLAIACAAVIAPFVISQLADALGSDWPRVHGTVLSIMVGVGVWCVVEISLVWLTAVWESECDRLIRDGGLPRAELVRDSEKK
jgi:hypothetical protein